MMAIKPGQNQQADQIRTVRRILMQLLNQSYPRLTLVKTLFRDAIYIEPTYDKETFIKDLFYIEQKGYLVFPDNVLNQGRKLMDKLTVLTAINPFSPDKMPSGKEIAEKTMTDEAMEI